MSGHPDFPQYSDGYTQIEYAEKVEQYWINDLRKQLKIERVKKGPNSARARTIGDFSEEEQKIVFDSDRELISSKALAAKHSTTVHVITEIVTKINKEFQKKATNKKRMEQSNMSVEEYQIGFKKYYEENGLRLPEDFSENEKKALIEDNVVNLIGPKVLSQKYKTTFFTIRSLVEEKGLNIVPDDMSMFHPDYPKKSDDTSHEE